MRTVKRRFMAPAVAAMALASLLGACMDEPQVLGPEDLEVTTQAVDLTGWTCWVEGSTNPIPCTNWLGNICKYGFLPDSGTLSCKDGANATGTCRYARQTTFELDEAGAVCKKTTPLENFENAEYLACSSKEKGTASASPTLGPFKNEVSVSLSESVTEETSFTVSKGCVEVGGSVTVEKGKTSGSTRSEEFSFKENHNRAVAGCDAYRAKVWVKAEKLEKEVPVVMRKRVRLWQQNGQALTFLNEEICHTKVIGTAIAVEYKKKASPAPEVQCSGCGADAKNCAPKGGECLQCAADGGMSMQSYADGGMCGCGDDVCMGDENCDTCPDDCGSCTDAGIPDGGSGCGDGYCDESEGCETCPGDCGSCGVPDAGPHCGDSVCSEDEDCATCTTDCGDCSPDAGSGSCGDGTCNDEEDCETCSSDCGPCPPPWQYCGNEVCDSGEDLSSCCQDCGSCNDGGMPTPDAGVSYPDSGYPYYPDAGYPYYPDAGYPYYPDAGYPYYPDAGYPYYQDAGYPYYPDAGYPYYPDAGYPYYQDAGYPYYPDAGYPYYQDAGYPYYQDAGYPYYQDAGYPYPYPYPYANAGAR
jgi:hypothetical protein